METIDLAHKAMKKFAPTILEHQYGLVGMTKNLLDFLVDHSNHFYVFYNYRSAFDLHISASEVRDEVAGSLVVTPEHTVRVSAKKTPFAWACCYMGHWYLRTNDGVEIVEVIEKNFWLRILDHWNNPGYVEINQYAPGLWLIVESDPTKPSS